MMSIILDILMELFPFHSNPIVNLFIATGTIYLTFQISWIIVGLAAPLLHYDSEKMSDAHWLIRISSTLLVAVYLTKMSNLITIGLSIIGFTVLFTKFKLATRFNF